MAFVCDDVGLCTVNVNNQYCGDLINQIINDEDYDLCISQSDTCNANCAHAINKVCKQFILAI